MGIDPEVIEQIRSARFPSSWGWRGYDRAEVEKYLEELAGWLEAGAAAGDRSESALDTDLVAELEEQIDKLQRQAGDARRRERHLMEELERVRVKLKARGGASAGTKRGQAAGRARAETAGRARSETAGRARVVEDGRETRTAGRGPRRPPARSARRGRQPSRSERHRAPTRPAREGARYDVNAIGLEELRRLGLSIRHSARLIGLRTYLGGFSSLDELDDVQGISSSELERLRASLFVERPERNR